jgi:hypothetical protein
MFELRNALVHMRLGDSDRQIAKDKVIGRVKAKRLREVAGNQGWLDSESALPSDQNIAEILGATKSKVSKKSSKVLPYAKKVEEWLQQGIKAKRACKRALCFSNIKYKAVKTILEKELDKEPLPPAVEHVLGPAHAGEGKFCRSSRELFLH